MTSRRRLRSIGLAWLLAQFLSGSFLASVSRAEVAATKKVEAKPKRTFEPEVETKLTDFFTKLKEAKRKQGQERLQKQIDELAKVTGLGADGGKALAKPSEQAAERSAETWLVKSEEVWRKQMEQAPEEIVGMLDQVLAQAGTYLENDFSGADADPAEEAVWTDALQRILTPEQADAWAKAQAKRKEIVTKELANQLKGSTDRIRALQEQGMRARIADIKRTLGLAKERAEKLDALAKRAMERSIEAWRVRAEKTFLSMPDAQRRQMAVRANFFLLPEEKDSPELQSVWKEGLAELITPEELKRLDAVRDDQKSRRVRILGQTMLALFDEKVAFTASQRERLQPIAERLVGDEANLFPDAGSDAYFSFSSESFLGAGKAATREELGAILDPIQCQHWQEAAATEGSARRLGGAARRRGPGVKPEPPEREPEPEQFEHLISDFLYEKAEAQGKAVRNVMILKAEDAVRAAHLSAHAASRLQTAARGVAEESLADWRTSVEESIRSNLSEATPRNVKQRLEGMEEYQFQQDTGMAPEKRDIWEKTVKAELSEPERAAWQNALKERITYRDKTVSSLILAEFDRKNFLSQEQWTQVEQMIATFNKEYGPDIQEMFSSSDSDSTPWYLQSYSMLLPLAGIPEKDLKAVLGKEQWDRWAGSQEFANSTQYWGNVRENHERRVKDAKQ